MRISHKLAAQDSKQTPISMGIELSRRHGSHVTLQAFQALVAEYHDFLAAGTPNYAPVRGSGAPHDVGHFDNRPR